jgi:GAF domain
MPVLPETRLPELRALLHARLQGAAESLEHEGADFFDASTVDMLRTGLARIGAHEGTVWLLDETREYLVPRFNSGPHAAEFVGHFRQSLRSGMISMVVATELPICENEVHKNRQQDPSLDRALKLQTCAMIAVPLYYLGQLRGVITGVQLKPAESLEADPPGFAMEGLAQLQRTASLLGRLIEHRLLTLILGSEFDG